MSLSLTFYFNDIFKNYDEWKEWSEQVGVVDFSDGEDAAFDKFCYKILSRNFCNCSIRYSTINEFLLQLAIVYEDKFNEFKNQSRLINKFYNLSENDLTVINESLTNMANNPNTEPDDPRQPLKYVSAQTFGLAKNGKIDSYLKALNNMPSLKIFDFINKASESGLSFKDLFMNVQPFNFYCYRRI